MTTYFEFLAFQLDGLCSWYDLLDARGIWERTIWKNEWRVIEMEWWEGQPTHWRYMKPILSPKTSILKIVILCTRVYAFIQFLTWSPSHKERRLRTRSRWKAASYSELRVPGPALNLAGITVLIFSFFLLNWETPCSGSIIEVARVPFNWKSWRVSGVRSSHPSALQLSSISTLDLLQSSVLRRIESLSMKWTEQWSDSASKPRRAQLSSLPTDSSSPQILKFSRWSKLSLTITKIYKHT